ncbi:hypothetical protein ACWGJB_45530 [Streptomyces sp. NPDC054813]
MMELVGVASMSFVKLDTKLYKEHNPIERLINRRMTWAMAPMLVPHRTASGWVRPAELKSR